MRKEIAFGVDFLSKLLGRLLLTAAAGVDSTAGGGPGAVHRFTEILTELLSDRYKDHWHPEEPQRGQGYRCLQATITGCDPTIREALKLSQILPQSNEFYRCVCMLTLWIDPGEVSYRIEGRGNNVREIASYKFNTWHVTDIDYSRLIKEIEQVCGILKLDPADLQAPVAKCLPSTAVRMPFPVDPPIENPTTIYAPAPVRSPRPPPPRARIASRKPSVQKFQLPSSGRSSSSDTDHSKSSQPPSPTAEKKPTKGYCGYVESYPYYYKMGKLHRALAAQRILTNYFRQQLARGPSYEGKDESMVASMLATSDYARQKLYQHQSIPMMIDPCGAGRNYGSSGGGGSNSSHVYRKL